MPSPIQLVPDHSSHDVAQALKDLLQAAQEGHISGMVFAVTIRGHSRGVLCDSAGTLYRDPLRGIGVVGLLLREMVDRVTRRQTDTAF